MSNIKTDDLMIKEYKIEALRIKEDSEITGKCNFEDANFWKIIQTVLSPSTAIASGITFFLLIGDFSWLNKIFQSQKLYIEVIHKILLVIAAFIAMVLSSLNETLKPHEKFTTHYSGGVNYLNLRDMARRFCNISTLNSDYKELKQLFENLTMRHAKLRESTPSHSSRAYKKVLEGLKNGETKYEIDLAAPEIN